MSSIPHRASVIVSGYLHRHCKQFLKRNGKIERLVAAAAEMSLCMFDDYVRAELVVEIVLIVERHIWVVIGKYCNAFR